MTQFKPIPVWTYHWQIVNYRLLSGYLNDYHRAGYEIVSASAYGWFIPRVLIVYRIKFL